MKPALTPDEVRNLLSTTLNDFAEGPMKATFESLVSHENNEVVVAKRGLLEALVTAAITNTARVMTANQATPGQSSNPRWAGEFLASIDECVAEWVKQGNMRKPNDAVLARMLTDRGIRSISGEPLKQNNVYRYLQDLNYSKIDRFRFHLAVADQRAHHNSPVLDGSLTSATEIVSNGAHVRAKMRDFPFKVGEAK